MNGVLQLAALDRGEYLAAFLKNSFWKMSSILMGPRKSFQFGSTFNLGNFSSKKTSLHEGASSMLEYSSQPDNSCSNVHC